MIYDVTLSDERIRPFVEGGTTPNFADSNDKAPHGSHIAYRRNAAVDHQITYYGDIPMRGVIFPRKIV